MDKFKNLFRNFMAGRYGIDRLNQILIYIAIIFNLILIFIPQRDVKSILSTLTIVILFIAFYRMMSRNITARYQENIKFMKATKPIRAEAEILKLRWQDRSEYRYVRCDKCRNVMRVPKGVGKIKVKCKNCGNEFIKRV